ncbi:unnamed protein product [Rotaria sp. Silwood1]|nr:unnamed protein product [Rotaria sp. Silwood1]CAF1606485.1 unnamed protein product [Rotaria sp. Silwood1]
MSNDMLYRQEMSKNIAAIIDGYVNIIYSEHEKEDISDLTIPIIQKKLKKMNEQIIFLHAENRLLYNYLIWYEKKIILNHNQEKRNSTNTLVLKDDFPHQILKHKTKQPLSIQKKREISETTFKVLLAYSQKYGINTIQYVDECINTMETDDETIEYLELELITLNKFIQKIDENLHNTQKKFTTEELSAFVHDRIRYRPELFKEIRTLTLIRNKINNTIQQLNHYNEIKQKMQDETIEYEKINDPLHEMIISYRVPSINNYVDLKSKQINLYRQIHAWKRKVEISERELHLRQIELINYPEKIIHPWKYLQNPSSILFYKHYKILNKQNEIHTNTMIKNKMNISLPKLNNKSIINIDM